jgi:hypothetical protein
MSLITTILSAVSEGIQSVAIVSSDGVGVTDTSDADDAPNTVDVVGTLFTVPHAERENIIAIKSNNVMILLFIFVSPLNSKRNHDTFSFV